MEKIDYQRSQSYHWFSSIYGLQLGHRLVFEPLESRVWTNSWSTFSKLRKFPRSTVNYHNPRGRHSRRIWVLKMLAERLLIVRGPGSCCLVSKYNIPSWNLTVKFYRKQGSTDQNRLVQDQAAYEGIQYKYMYCICTCMTYTVCMNHVWHDGLIWRYPVAVKKEQLIWIGVWNLVFNRTVIWDCIDPLGWNQQSLCPFQFPLMDTLTKDFWVYLPKPLEE